MSEESHLERLKTTFVTELNFGSASTRHTNERRAREMVSAMVPTRSRIA